MRVLASLPRHIWSLPPAIFILKWHCEWLLSAMVVRPIRSTWKEVKPTPSTEFLPSVFWGANWQQPWDLEVLVANKKHHKKKKNRVLYQRINFRKLNCERLIWTPWKLVGKLIISGVKGFHLRKCNIDKCTGNFQGFKMKISSQCSWILPNVFFKWLKAFLAYDWEILDKVCWFLQINDTLMGKKKKGTNS